MKKLTIIIGITLLSLTSFGQGPCDSANPPAWCNDGSGGPCVGNNPPTWCGTTTNTPINGELWVLIVIGLCVSIRYLK